MKNDVVISNFTGNVFRRAVLPERRTAVSPDVSAFLNGTDIEGDGSNGAKIVTPYAQSSWVYIAINRLARKVAGIPFRISRLGGGQARRVRSLMDSGDPRQRGLILRALGETVIDSGPVVDLFARPHPSMSKDLFWEMVVTWQCLRGEFFILPLDNSDGPVDLADRAPRVQRLITVPTELFWHVVVGYELDAWRYTGSPLLTPIPSEMLSPTEVIHSRSPNPYLYWRGMSPLLLAMGPAGADYAASRYAQGYWMNNADTGVIVTTDQQATPEQQKAILAALRERKRKAGTADRPLFLWGGAKVDKPQLSGMEQQFIENREMNRQEIGAIYEVPDSIMGFSGSKATPLTGGGAAMMQENITFITNTIMPLCRRLESAVAPVVQTFGDDLIGWFDVESDPAMQEARRNRVATAVQAFGIGASFNDVNSVYDLGFQKKPWGDKSFLPFSLQEVTATGLGSNEPLPTEDDPTEPEPDADPDDAAAAAKANPFARLKLLLDGGASVLASRAPQTNDAANLWRRLARMRLASVGLIKGKVGKVLMAYRKRTLAKLDEIHLEKSAGRLGEIKSLIDLIFNPNEFGASLNAELAAPLQSILQSAGEEQIRELGGLGGQSGTDDPWKYPPKAVLDFLSNRTQPIMGVGGTVRDQLNTSLEAGINAGETHAQLAARVKAVYNNLGDGDAKRVAQTEVNVAYNTARHQAQADAGIEYKAWLHTYSGHPRETHMIAGETYSREEPIPIDEPFYVDGEPLMYPCDPSGSPGNVINCHCINLAVMKTGADENVTTYKIVGLGEFKFKKTP